MTRRLISLAADSTNRQAERSGRVYLSPPDMSECERDALLKAFDSGWLAPVGPDLDAFEEEFAEYVGVKHAIAVASGTAALHLALCVLGVGPGDEVVTSTLTFVATANAICYTGAQPVFIDSELSSWNIDPNLLEQELESRQRAGRQVAAVIAVDILGQCADYQLISKICADYGVPLIEDAAESLGAQYLGQPAGSFGQIGCFSFNGNKIMTTSGGGMVVTNDDPFAARVRHLAAQAREPTLHFEHHDLGFNYRLSNLLAAVGRAQLRRLDYFVDRKRTIFKCYQACLGELPGLRFMPEPEANTSTRWLTCVLIDEAEFGASRDDVIAALEEQNVESRPVWKPMHLQPLYCDHPIRGGEVAKTLSQTGLCLPSGSSLTESQLLTITETIRQTSRHWT